VAGTRADPARLARLRSASQALHRPSALRDPVAVVQAAGPVQAQDPRPTKHAFRARARKLTAADIDRARTEERSLLRAWVMRKTAHLFPSEDAGWILPIFARVIVPWSRRRLADFGFDARAQERALEVIHRAVERDGPLTRPELVERLERAGFEAATEAKYHLWGLATLDGELCLGPDRNGLTCLVRTRDWIGELRSPPREQALGELALRYLRAFGPASERDFARWAGLPLRDTSTGLRQIAAELDEVNAGDDRLMVVGRPPRVAPSPVVRLLGAYDNYNLAYVSRAFAVGPEGEKRINPGGGLIRPSVVVDGRAVATWSSKRTGKRLTVTVDPFAPLDDDVLVAIGVEVADLGRFESLEATLA
jgi:Winged helix DNA-binding domain